MTVIAAYNYNGCGVVMGDILITGETVPKNISIPTIGDVSDFFSGEWGIHKPSQKVSIISSRCAIAWSGSYLGARLFVSRLRRLSLRLNVNVNIIEKLYSKIKEGEISIVGAIYNEEYIETFGFGAEKLGCQRLGNVFAAGSGISAIKQFIELLPSIDTSATAADEISAKAASLAITQVAHLLNAEFRKGDAATSIQEFFGGGYEVAVFYNGEFRKLNVNYIFLDVSHGVDGYLKLGNPKLFISQNYNNGNLRYQSISTTGPYDDKILRNEIIELKSFADGKNNKIKPSYDAVNFSCFVFVDDFRYFGEALISTVVKSLVSPLDFSIQDGFVNFCFSDKTMFEIERYLLEIYRKPPDIPS